MEKKKIVFRFPISVQAWKDKKTGCQILYSKKYNVSAYGATKAEAKEMFMYQIANILTP